MGWLCLVPHTDHFDGPSAPSWDAAILALQLRYWTTWRYLRRVAGSLWNTLWSVTLEHNHFSLTLEHKMIHVIKTMPTTQTWDLLTGALLWKGGAFQSEVGTKKRPPMKIIVVRKPSLFKMRTLTRLRTQEQNVTHLRTLIISHSCSNGVG